MSNKLRLHGCAMKVEGQYGVDAGPTPAANAVQLDESPWNTIEVKFLEDNEHPNVAGLDMGAGGEAVAPGGRYAEFTVVLPLRGAADFATIPDMDVVLAAAGFTRSEGVPGANKRTWSSKSLADAGASVTAYLWAGGYLFKVVGVRGSVSWPAIPSRPVPITFKAWGLVREDPVDAALPAFTYRNRAVARPKVSGAPLTLNGFAPRCHSAAFDVANEVVALPRSGAEDGHDGYEIVDYTTTIKAVIDTPLAAAFNPWTLQRTTARFPWSFEMQNASPFNRFSILGPAGELKPLRPGDKDKMTTMDLTIGVCRDIDQSTPPIRIVQS
ncbi:MAG TPA: hypothetical protein VGC13_22285 [Longimicrobium sp.]|jgi:hypothetical protein|uniref:hypothetical protein n=1 Tax=Longimicrobium sp. TaxID=2029185 RepID=UPI002ED906F4